MGVDLSPEDFDLFFNRFDRDRDGRILFSEFAYSLTPNDSYYASVITRRQSTGKRMTY